MKMFSLIGLGVLLILAITFSGGLLETNNAGFYQVKQAAFTGDMSVRFTPGLYMQNFGTLYTYKNVVTVGFGRDNDGDGAADIDAIPVIFNDGSKAAISGLVRIKLPNDVESALKIKREYANGMEHFVRSGIVPIVTNAVKLSANLRSAQDAYTTLAIFQQAVEDQLRNGAYVTKSDTIKVVKSTGDEEEQKVTVIVTDKDGNPKRLNNRLQELGCEVTEAVIDVPAFDASVDNMIAKRKDEAMKTELSKQSALRAKQDAITAAEQGKADVAKAEAEALVIKKRAVVEAEQEKAVAELEAAKKFQVAQYAAKEALENAKKIEAEGMAKAAANRELVKAGLTPLEKATIEKDTRIGVAKALAETQFPTVFVAGGEKGGNVGMIEAIGYNQLFELTQKINQPKAE